MQDLSRVLSFEKLDNFRDLGGYIGHDGRAVRSGLLFRGPALSLLQTEADLAHFRALGVVSVMDFRSSKEREDKPDNIPQGVAYYPVSAITAPDGSEVNFDLPSLFGGTADDLRELFRSVHTGYARLPFANQAYRQMFRLLIDGQTPLYFHCTAGKDRTGVAAALILLALGVPREQVRQDYLLTNACRVEVIGRMTQRLAPRFGEADAAELAQLLCGVQEESLNLALDAIESRYATYEAFFEEEYGITPQLREKLYAMYLQQEG